MPKKPLVLSINVPFCARRCDFCESQVLTGTTAAAKEAYVTALYAEMAALAPDMADHRVVAVRVGGGSPSLLGGAVLAQMLGQVRALFDVDPACEMTVETAPGGVSVDLMQKLAKSGVDRFDVEMDTSDVLEHMALGIASAQGAADDAARVALFGRRALGTSVLYGVRGQGVASLRSSIDRAFNMGAVRVTLRPLRIVAGTGVAADYEKRRGQAPSSPRYVYPDDERRLVLYRTAAARLEERGYVRRTAWHFCLPSCEDRTVRAFCAGCDVLGLGAGAASRYGDVACRTVGDVDAYVANAADYTKTTAWGRALDEGDRARVALANGLFAAEGVAERAAADAVAACPALAAALDDLVARSLLERADGALRLTDAGVVRCGDVRSRLLDDAGLAGVY